MTRADWLSLIGLIPMFGVVAIVFFFTRWITRN